MLPLLATAALSGLFAGIVASTVALGIEKLGGAKGGVLGSIPTTIMPATIGLWYTILVTGPSGSATQQSIMDFQRSMLVIAPGMLANAAFLYCWRLLPWHLTSRYPSLESKNLTLLGLVAGGAFLVWFLLVTALVLVSEYSLTPPLSPASLTSPHPSVFLIATDSNQQPMLFLALVSLFLLASLGIAGTWHAKPTPKSNSKTPARTTLLRAAAAAVAIFLAVLLGHLNPILGGIMSFFPAIFGTAMVSVWLSSGRAVSVGAVEPLMLGSCSVVVFAIAVSFLLPGLDAVLEGGVGAVVAAVVVAFLAAAGCVSVPAFVYISWRGKVNAAGEEAPTVDGQTTEMEVVEEGGVDGKQVEFVVASGETSPEVVNQ
ncbi:hypothetical protein BC830DRAFT_1086180 [Chytriomyces sp. MP71]|nr:hypothetical protein BC830DRAFT_1086180 [Chytriomyces sp. MP71]